MDRRLHDLHEIRNRHTRLLDAWHRLPTGGLTVQEERALSRYFDDRPFRAALWFQSVGNTRGQSWAGLFRDVDGNGVLEFAAAGPDSKDGMSRPLPGRWTSELNFLSWQPHDGPAESFGRGRRAARS